MEEVKQTPQLNDRQRSMLPKASRELAIVAEAPTQIKKMLSFPDEQAESRGVPCTINNVRTVLDGHGVTVRYNMMTKDVDVQIPGRKGTVDNKAEASLAFIISLAAGYGMQTFNVPMFLDAIADENAYHPLAEWIRSKDWDGKDRLEDICATIEVAEDYPKPLRDELIRKWLLSVVAATLMASGFHGRGVLTLQGPQGIGKTSWLRRC